MRGSLAAVFEGVDRDKFKSHRQRRKCPSHELRRQSAHSSFGTASDSSLGPPSKSHFLFHSHSQPSGTRRHSASCTVRRNKRMRKSELSTTKTRRIPKHTTPAPTEQRSTQRNGTQDTCFFSLRETFAEEKKRKGSAKHEYEDEHKDKINAERQGR